MRPSAPPLIPLPFPPREWSNAARRPTSRPLLRCTSRIERYCSSPFPSYRNLINSIHSCTDYRIHTVSLQVALAQEEEDFPVGYRAVFIPFLIGIFLSGSRTFSGGGRSSWGGGGYKSPSYGKRRCYRTLSVLSILSILQHPFQAVERSGVVSIQRPSYRIYRAIFRAKFITEWSRVVL